MTLRGSRTLGTDVGRTPADPGLNATVVPLAVTRSFESEGL
jgi:hypothetical protein